MIYTKNVNKAIKFMFEKHKNQFDKQGIPYVFHPWHVAESMETEDETIVALLHDVLEDTDATIKDLTDLGLSNDIIEAVVTMTHKDDEDYFDYIERISKNPLATVVKIADLKHNMDITRFAAEIIPDKYLKKYQIYSKSLEYLENILQNQKELKTK